MLSDELSGIYAVWGVWRTENGCYIETDIDVRTRDGPSLVEQNGQGRVSTEKWGWVLWVSPLLESETRVWWTRVQSRSGGRSAHRDPLTEVMVSTGARDPGRYSKSDPPIPTLGGLHTNPGVRLYWYRGPPRQGSGARRGCRTVGHVLCVPNGYTDPGSRVDGPELETGLG